MHSDLSKISDGLEAAPALLANLIDQVPRDLYQQQRIPGKWTIHEHACHLVDAQKMINSRFLTFQQQESPEFEVYLPGATFKDDYLMSMDLPDTIHKFPLIRSELMEIIGSYTSEIWERNAKHPEYKEYDPYILLRHTLMHDHFHMYRIEELWLTRETYLRKG